MSMNDEYDASPDRIAIIGMSGRFPGADSVDEFWELICDGAEAISFFGPDELDADVDPALAADPQYVRARGVMPGADCFDAAFFGIAPMEAQVIDPQARVLLEVAWGALEDAGYNPRRQSSLVGVFAGSGFNSYLVDNVLSRQDVVENYGRHLVELANAPDYLATRISYKLDLKGPSVSLYTGCSSSLVAACYAVESLLNHQCDMALAGGAFVATPPRSGYLYHAGEMSSPDGHTRPFDADAAGTVFSSGAGMVLLKRLDDALTDGDHIYATILGTGLNNDGSDKVSFTAPSVQGQATAIALAHSVAGVTPEAVSYVETHGTGTPLGDPIEIEALTKAFGRGQASGKHCAIGSVKANIGHLDAAAGIAGLIKVALSLHHRKLPPSINYHRSNPAIPFDASPFFVNTELRDWQAKPGSRIAGVSSFGVGGTNAHVVLAEAPLHTSPGNPTEPGWAALQLSARTPTALERITEQTGAFLERHPELNLLDIEQTLRMGRESFKHRRVVVCRSTADAAQALLHRTPTQIVTPEIGSEQRQTVFMFTGQGAQFPGMGRGLYSTQPVFRKEVDDCAEILRPILGIDLREVLFPESAEAEERAAELISETWLTQPALFTVEYALVRLWEALGVIPNACVGHSIGEYVAACVGGVFSREDALALVALRGGLMFGCERGSMLAVMSSAEDVTPRMDSSLSIGAVNAPGVCVISGPSEAISKLRDQLTADGIPAKPLRTSHAFHSSMMDPIIEEFAEAVSKVTRNLPSIPFVSNVTGTWIQASQATDPWYWSNHIRNTVRFSDCIRTLLKTANSNFIEIGPGSTLRSLTTAHMTPSAAQAHLVLSSLPGAKETLSEDAFLLRSLGSLWTSGQPVRWPSAEQPFRKVALPTYSFERTRHWILGKRPTPESLRESAPEPTLGDATPTDTADSGSLPSTLDTLTIVLNRWCLALGYQSIERDADFFALGGNSLIGANVIAQLKQEFAVEIGPLEIYTNRTAETLASLINDRLEARPPQNRRPSDSEKALADARRFFD